jgi:hypothetical protein
MRICLYVGKAPPPEKQKEWLATARTTCDVYARNLHREFTARGHEVVFASSLSATPKGQTPEAEAKRHLRYEAMEYPEADHAICLEQHGFKRREPVFIENVRKATKGLVCSICDKDHEIGPEDLLFTARRPAYFPATARYVGWAADPAVFKPEKDPDWLTIFIDHKSNAFGRYDDTEAILKSATSYAATLAREGRKAGDPPRRVRVVFFSPNGLEEIDPTEVRDVDLGDDPRAFYRRVPAADLAAWIRKSDIFVVTHGESMGLPVLESAMAGALVVAGRGFIKPELLRSLGHYEYDRVDEIDWDRLSSELDPRLYRRRAMHFTWGAVAERMLQSLEGRDPPVNPPAKRFGDLLVTQPVPVEDPGFASLAAWHVRSANVEQDADGERLVPTATRDTHYARLELYKKPWPQTFTLTFFARTDGVHDLRVWLSGETSDEKAEVHFALGAATASERRTSGGWACLDAKAIRVDDWVLCQMVVQSDWAARVRCSLIVARGNELTFEAAPGAAGVTISGLQLAVGVGVTVDLQRSGVA